MLEILEALASRYKSARCYTLHRWLALLTYELALYLNDNLLYEVDSTQEALYGGAMADELKRENQRERTLIDPVLKFLFDKDRDEILRLMLGAPVRVVQVLDSVLPSSEQRSDGVLLVEDVGEQFLLHIEFMTRVASNMGSESSGTYRAFTNAMGSRSARWFCT